MLFSGLRNISLQILRIVGRVWNEGSRMLCQRLPSPSTITRLSGDTCINQASSYLEGTEQAFLQAFTKQGSPAMGNVIDPKPLTNCILP